MYALAESLAQLHFVSASFRKQFFQSLFQMPSRSCWSEWARALHKFSTEETTIPTRICVSLFVPYNRSDMLSHWIKILTSYAALFRCLFLVICTSLRWWIQKSPAAGGDLSSRPSWAARGLTVFALRWPATSACPSLWMRWCALAWCKWLLWGSSLRSRSWRPCWCMALARLHTATTIKCAKTMARLSVWTRRIQTCWAVLTTGFSRASPPLETPNLAVSQVGQCKHCHSTLCHYNSALVVWTEVPCLVEIEPLQLRFSRTCARLWCHNFGRRHFRGAPLEMFQRPVTPIHGQNTSCRQEVHLIPMGWTSYNLVVYVDFC